MWNNTPVVTFTLLFSNILDKIRHIRHYILIQGCIIDSRQLITHRIIFTINRMCLLLKFGQELFSNPVVNHKAARIFFFFNEKIWKKNTIAKLRLSKHKEWRYNYIVINLYIFFICFPCWNGKKNYACKGTKVQLTQGARNFDVLKYMLTFFFYLLF